MPAIAVLKSLVKRVVPARLRGGARQVIYRLANSRWKGFSMRFNSPDRVFLEDCIFPYLLKRPDLRRILFVGCEWYTKAYPAIFKSREFWTLEIDPAKARYGSSTNHVIDGLENLSKRFQPGFFDAIIHTGVFGWGIDTPEAAEQSFLECHLCLRPGGAMVFGWDDVPTHRSFPVIEECEALRRFEAVEFPPVGVHQYLTADNALRHTFNFFRKRSS